VTTAIVPCVSGGQEEHGHLGEGVGAAFAAVRIKATSSILLPECAFEMGQPADTYRNDHSKMLVQLERLAVEGALPQARKAMS
jgi:hypothetical protein